MFHGGLEDLGRFHLSIVRGDTWPDGEGGSAWSAAGDWMDGGQGIRGAGPMGGRGGPDAASRSALRSKMSKLRAKRSKERGI